MRHFLLRILSIFRRRPAPLKTLPLPTPADTANFDKLLKARPGITLGDLVDIHRILNQSARRYSEGGYPK